MVADRANPSVVERTAVPRRSPGRQAMQGPRRPAVLRVRQGRVRAPSDMPLVRGARVLQLLIVVMALVVALGIALTWAGV